MLACTPLNLTTGARPSLPIRFVPLIVTCVPAPPEVGRQPVAAPPGAVTTSCDGLALISVAGFAGPKSTTPGSPSAPTRADPATVTVVPATPEAGTMLATDGATQLFAAVTENVLADWPVPP